MTASEEKVIVDFISQCRTISINTIIKQETIKVRKAYITKLLDGMIIATALYLDLPLITADSDFKKLKNLL
ncbi:PIN domain-containing protein [Winogradskyella forsetii]|uniref:PIN domain-containing protein n=1 Tax=Winogradskyella forsetii TaxID=2686077 RepID=UPI0015BC8BF6